jgi:geranylgeranyl pyrophosphate synthase
VVVRASGGLHPGLRIRSCSLFIREEIMRGASTKTPFAERVRSRLADCVRDVVRQTGLEGGEERLAGGKMLRTRLAGRIRECAGAADPDALAEVCTAAELVHSASLCHDDVVDGSEMRRGGPSLWTEVGRTGAILVGDLLFAEAVRMVRAAGDGKFVADFADKMKETSAAEAEQELVWRGKKPDEETHIRLARGKTGPLFAFTAAACAEPGGPGAAELEAIAWGLPISWPMTWWTCWGRSRPRGRPWGPTGAGANTRWP